MDESENSPKKNTTIRLPPTKLEQLDWLRRQLPYRESRTKLFEKMMNWAMPHAVEWVNRERREAGLDPILLGSREVSSTENPFRQTR